MSTPVNVVVFFGGAAVFGQCDFGLILAAESTARHRTWGVYLCYGSVRLILLSCFPARRFGDRTRGT